MGMNMRFVPNGPVDLTWPPRVMGFDAESHSFRLAKGYRAIIDRITGISLHDELDLAPEVVAHISAALNAVARDRLRREAAVFGRFDPVLRFVARNGVPAFWRPLIILRLTRANADCQAQLNDMSFEQLARMFKIYTAAGSRLVDY